MLASTMMSIGKLSGFRIQRFRVCEVARAMLSAQLGSAENGAKTPDVIAQHFGGGGGGVSWAWASSAYCSNPKP